MNNRTPEEELTENQKFLEALEGARRFHMAGRKSLRESLAV